MYTRPNSEAKDKVPGKKVSSVKLNYIYIETQKTMIMF